MKGQWEEVVAREGAPGARSSHAIAVVGSRVLVFGGELEPRVPINSTVHALDLETHRWTELPASGHVPAPRIGVTMVALGPVLFVFGGRDAQHSELNELYSLDTRTGEWALLSQGDDSPPARSYHAMAVDEASGTIFVFGGCGSAGRLSDLWAYSPAQGQWTALASSSPPEGSSCVGRGGASLVVAGGAVWVVFGFCGHELKDLHRFDLSTKTWQEMLPASSDELWPAARSVFGAVPLGKEGQLVAVFGGEVDPSDLGHAGAGKFSEELYVLDTRSTTWSRMEARGKGPGPRGWFPVAALPSGMLVYGGNSEANSRLDDMFILHVDLD